MSPAVRCLPSSTEETELLPSSSVSLILDHPTSAELIDIWTQTAAAWGRHLTLDTYVARELRSKATSIARDGGITHWVLVAASSMPDCRTIYASCDTLRKEIWIVRAGEYNVESSIAHCVSSVWCSPHLRGRGYAGRMMKQLGIILEDWQAGQSEVCCSVLYSDIGKDWYARYGWHPFEIQHVKFPVKKVICGGPLARALDVGDFERLSLDDMAKLGDDLRRTVSERTRIAFIPEHQVLDWFCAREDIATRYNLDRETEVRGAVAGEIGSRVWAFFHRAFYGPVGAEESKITFHILRLVVENEQETFENAASLKAVMELAQSEAVECRAHKVDLWNPSPLIRKLITMSGLVHSNAECDSQSIPCLKWYGGVGDNVEWLALEKFCWF